MMLPTINRAVIMLIPKQPFFDWANSLFPDLQIGPDNFFESPAFLISDEDESEDVYDLVEPHLQEIFEEVCVGICPDSDRWPETLDKQLFKNWFDIKYSSMASDLLADEPIEHDDPFEGIDFDALDEIDEDELDVAMFDDLEERGLIIDIQKHKDSGGKLPEA